jgi:mycothiol system anti-sigma-R factor
MDRVISCAQAVERLWEFLDHDLADRDHQAIEAHLAFCRRCCGELEFAKHLRGLLAAKGTGELPAAVRDRLDRFIGQLAHQTGVEGER